MPVSISIPRLGQATVTCPDGSRYRAELTSVTVNNSLDSYPTVQMTGVLLHRTSEDDAPVGAGAGVLASHLVIAAGEAVGAFRQAVLSEVKQRLADQIVRKVIEDGHLRYYETDQPDGSIRIDARLSVGRAERPTVTTDPSEAPLPWAALVVHADPAEPVDHPSQFVGKPYPMDWSDIELPDEDEFEW